MGGNLKMRLARLIALLPGMVCDALIATPTSAQLTSTINGVQTRMTADPNGIDFVTGTFNSQRTDLTLGPNAQAPLAIVTQHGSGPGDNCTGQIYSSLSP